MNRGRSTCREICPWSLSHGKVLTSPNKRTFLCRIVTAPPTARPGGMLASRLHRRNSGLVGQSKPTTQEDSQERDSRPVEEVVEAAAAATGEQEAAAVVIKALTDHNVCWAWQLEHASEAHWTRFHASLGLELAVKAELANPSSGNLNKFRPEDVPARLRHFLLMPDLDGKPPKRLRAFGSMIFGLLTVPPHDRQNLVIAVLEMMGLVSGLMLPIPFSMLQQSWALAIAEKGWTVQPTIEDGQRALAALNFGCLLVVAVFAIIIAFYVAAAGHRASLQFYENLMPCLSAMIAVLVFGGIWPLLALFWWQLFIAATNPAPVLCAASCTYGTLVAFLTMMNYFSTIEMALELYHLPHYVVFVLHFCMPWLSHRLSDKALEPAAQLRAAELRALLGLEQPPLLPKKDFRGSVVAVRPT